MTKRKKYGKKGHGGEKSHEFFRRLSIIEDFIQSVKNVRLTLALKAI